jgi:hypothetical protein
VYTETVEALPPVVKGEVFRRLGEILAGRLVDERYGHLTPGVRQTILEILSETLTGFDAIDVRVEAGG